MMGGADDVDRGWTWYEQPWSDERCLFFWMAAVLTASMCSICVCLVSGVLVPYGRYHSAKSFGLTWGPGVNGKLAWFIQESPTLIVPAILLSSMPPLSPLPIANMGILALFLIHYAHRVLVFPLLMRGGKDTPLAVMGFAFMFCMINGYLQARYLTHLVQYPISHIYSPAFLIGVPVWALGFGINVHIPHGGMFEYVSGANFFGEIVEWVGFALASGGAMCAVLFAIATACNIGPRAIQHHRWYHDKFESYPKDRCALIPFIL